MTRPRDCWGLAGKLVSAWNGKRAVRLGEAAVASRLLHTISPQEPDTVRVLTNADAGQVFYKRSRVGEIVHLDLFHEVMEVQPREVSDWISSSVRAYQTDWSVLHGSNQLPDKLANILDLIDIQTGAGGGRLTGRLQYGQRQSLRQSHMNHVHLTLLLPDRLAVLVLYLANSLERYLLQHSIDIRRINRIVMEEGPAGYQPGSDEYSAYTDSLLLQYQPELPYGGMENNMTDLSPDTERTADHLVGLSLGPQPTSADPARSSFADRRNERSYVAQLCNLQMVDSTGNAVSHEGHRLRGKMVQSFDRTLKPSSHYGSEYFGPVTLSRTAGSPGHKTEEYRRGTPLNQLAVVETMTAYWRRRMRVSDPTPAITAEDLRVVVNRSHAPCNICLLIDASASMKGRRLQAATTLAKHLVAATRDKVAVLIFQESEVRLTVPFTRKIQELNAGLGLIKPYGLTPLAAGLAYAKDYLGQTKVGNPLLVLISDGIPTVPIHSNDPIRDAVEEAGRLHEASIRFCCIGLEPNQSVLAEVTAAARGKLHIVKELDSDSLVQIVVKERDSVHA